MSEPETATNKTDHYDPSAKKSLYQGFMDFGFAQFLPLGGAITMFVMLLLMGTGLITTIFVTFLTWLGLYGLSKTFFVH